MNKRTIFLGIFSIGMVFCLVMCTGITPGMAEGNYPGKWYGWWNPHMDRDPGYTGEITTIQGYPYAEQKVLNSWGYKANDVDEIKDLIPGIFYQMVKQPEKWGPIRINETAYISRNDTELMKRYFAATEKYKGQASLDEKGQLLNYTAGCPFPGSTDPVELAWNFDKMAWYGDAIYAESIARIIDANGNARTSMQDFVRFKYDGRLFGENAPLYLPNPKRIDNISAMGFTQPYSIRGIVQLTVRYNEAKKDDDMWMYLPALRRTRRMSTAQRWDRVPGGNVDTWDTVAGWSGRVINYEWKYLGRKKMLAGHNSSPMVQMPKNKAGSPPDQNYQRMEVLILEVTPKPYMNAPISKALLHIDPESYVLYYTEAFDKKGRPSYLFVGPQVWDKKGQMSNSTMQTADFQRTYASPPVAFNQNFGTDIPEVNNPNFYAIANLKKHFGSR